MAEHDASVIEALSSTGYTAEAYFYQLATMSFEPPVVAYIHSLTRDWGPYEMVTVPFYYIRTWCIYDTNGNLLYKEKGPITYFYSY